MIESRSKLTLLQTYFSCRKPFRRTGGKAKGNGKPDYGFANTINHVLSSELSDNSLSGETGCSASAIVSSSLAVLIRGGHRWLFVIFCFNGLLVCHNS
jgi:hypothetical protein